VNVVVTNTNATTATRTNGYTYIAHQFDANNDGAIDPSDIFYLVNFLLSGGAAPAGPAGMLSGDANGDNLVDPADIFYLVNYLFLGGPQPAALTPRVATTNAATSLTGSVRLGAAIVRGDRTFIPVTVTVAPGADAQAFALKVRVTGDASVVAIRRAGVAKDVQPAFEVTRGAADGGGYLVMFREGRVLGGPAVVAEIELARGDGAVRVDVDPAMTLLSSGGTQQATVDAGTLEVRGVTVSRAVERRQLPREKN
jgi:hypothetical protein